MASEQKMQMDAIDTEESAESTGILGRSIRGGGWLTAGYIAEKAVNVLSFFVLARLLTPTDFGMTAIILLVPRLFQSVTEPGFAAAAIQKEGDVTAYLNPIWTMRILKSLLIALVVFLAGPFIASYFHAAEAVIAIRLGGLLLVVQNFGNIGEIYFFKNLDFKKLVARNLSRQAAYVIVTIIAAVYLHSYWALVLGNVALYATEAVSTYVLHPYRPRLSFDWRKLKNLFHFGKWIFWQGIFDQAYGLIENTIVGRVTNPAAVGIYTKAKSLSGVVPGFLTSVISVVSLSAYTKIKGEPTKAHDGLKKSLDVIMFFLLPVSIAMFVGGGTLILRFLGAPWLPMVNPLRILLIYFGVNILIDLAYEVCNGLGYPDKKIKIDTTKIILTTILLLILTPLYGTVGAALALGIGILPPFIATVQILHRLTRFSWIDIVRAFLIPGIASALTALVFLPWKTVILAQPLLLLTAIGIGAGLFYFGIIVICGRRLHLGPYNTITIILRYLHLPPIV